MTRLIRPEHPSTNYSVPLVSRGFRIGVQEKPEAEDGDVALDEVEVFGAPEADLLVHIPGRLHGARRVDDEVPLVLVLCFPEAFEREGPGEAFAAGVACHRQEPKAGSILFLRGRSAGTIVLHIAEVYYRAGDAVIRRDADKDLRIRFFGELAHIGQHVIVGGLLIRFRETIEGGVDVD